MARRRSPSPGYFGSGLQILPELAPAAALLALFGHVAAEREALRFGVQRGFRVRTV
jgi:hypothetical protein